MAPPKSNDDPNAFVVVTEGPLKGGIVTLIADVDGDRVRAVVSGHSYLTPPIILKKSQLKDRMLGVFALPWWGRIVVIGVLIGLMLFWLTQSPIAFSALMFCSVASIACHVEAVSALRRIKTCPGCGAWLEDENYFSRCTSCNWKRSLPEFCADSFAEFYELSTELLGDASSEKEKAISEYVRPAWYVIVLELQVLALSFVVPILLSIWAFDNPWPRWGWVAFAALAFGCFAVRQINILTLDLGIREPRR